MLTFPICYIIGDLVCEVWGYRRTTLLIWAGFLMNFIFGAAGILIPFIHKLKKAEGEDTFDRDIDYGIFWIFKNAHSK